MVRPAPDPAQQYWRKLPAFLSTASNMAESGPQLRLLPVRN